MHAHDRHLARARSKAHMRDTSKDEARAFTRAVRRFGKALTHMAKGDIRAASGATRWVLLVGPYAFKMPLLVHGGRLFLLGCLANISERSTSQEANGDLRLARTYACSPLGLLAVAERITGPLLLRRLTRGRGRCARHAVARCSPPAYLPRSVVVITPGFSEVRTSSGATHIVPNGDWHAKRRTSAMARAASLTFGRPRTRGVVKA